MGGCPTRKIEARTMPVQLDDFKALAKARISSEIFDYIDCGACDEITTHSNGSDLGEIRLIPFCLRDVSDLDLARDLLGHSFSFPIGFSPTAFHRLVHEGGEVATARAARNLNIPMIVSSMSSIPLETIARDSRNKELWFQTYIFKDRGVTKELVQRAESSGYKSIVLTVCCPLPGKRDRNVRNRFVVLPAKTGHLI